MFKGQSDFKKRLYLRIQQQNKDGLAYYFNWIIIDATSRNVSEDDNIEEKIVFEFDKIINSVISELLSLDLLHPGKR
jgi:hypothetical protein